MNEITILKKKEKVFSKEINISIEINKKIIDVLITEIYSQQSDCREIDFEYINNKELLTEEEADGIYEFITYKRGYWNVEKNI